MKPIVLSAGLGTRLRPATRNLPKALFPFLNVPLIDRRLAALARQGFRQAAVNLHHEGRQLVEHLGETGASGVAVRFFWEPVILGTAGAVKNAEAFFEDEEAAIWNVDAEIDADLPSLLRAHRREGNVATLLVVPSPDPRRFTPLHAEGSRLISIGGLAGGGTGKRPLLFTGVSILSREAIDRIGSGPRSLVEDLWRPLLEEGRSRIGVVFHEGSARDLGTPADVVAASIEAIGARDFFDPPEGFFDRVTKVLASDPEVVPAAARRCVIGRARIAGDAEISDSVIADGAEIGRGARITGSLIGPVRVDPGERLDGMFCWPDDSGTARIPLHDSSQRRDPALK
jgi:NDP-sugar pyrophosphorylase family protein